MAGRKLNILWTNTDPITAEKMVFMYAINGKVNNWWEEITLIIWGGTVKLAAEDPIIQEKIRMALHIGVHVTASKACADQLEVSEDLEALGVEIKYWGQGLTDILKIDEKLLTI